MKLCKFILILRFLIHVCMQIISSRLILFIVQSSFGLSLVYFSLALKYLNWIFKRQVLQIVRLREFIFKILCKMRWLVFIVSAVIHRLAFLQLVWVISTQLSFLAAVIQIVKLTFLFVWLIIVIIWSDCSSNFTIILVIILILLFHIKGFFEIVNRESWLITLRSLINILKLLVFCCKFAILLFKSIYLLLQYTNFIFKPLILHSKAIISVNFLLPVIFLSIDKSLVFFFQVFNFDLLTVNLMLHNFNFLLLFFIWWFQITNGFILFEAEVL